MSWRIGATILFSAFSVLCAGVAVYAFFVEPYHLEVTHLRLPLRGMKSTLRPIRLVQFSDLHCDSQVRLERQIPDAIAREKPDIIVFTGDALNCPEGAPICRELMTKIMRLAPVYCVKGDWDVDPRLTDAMCESGINEMNGYKVLDIRGTKLCIMGDDLWMSQKQLVQSTRKKVPASIPGILITHQPDNDVVMSMDTAGVDLLLCGHTHGGQVALPFYGPIITHSKLGREYSIGLNRMGAMWMYTNRGIGMEGRFPRARFCSPPELTVIDLVPASG